MGDASAGGGGDTTPCPSTFVGDVELMNVTSYIRRCHITDKHIRRYR
jgi:hypothetical protein